jgi:hypothetical protein
LNCVSPNDNGSGLLEFKYPVTSSVRTTVRNGFELITIVFVILLPLAVTAFTKLNTDISTWEIITFGAAGTLIWWCLCWFAFWLIV